LGPLGQAAAHQKSKFTWSQYERSLEIRERLAKADSTSAAAQRDVSLILNRLGDVSGAAGDPAEALRNTKGRSRLQTGWRSGSDQRGEEARSKHQSQQLWRRPPGAPKPGGDAPPNKYGYGNRMTAGSPPRPPSVGSQPTG
jgi:hypothetical protein